MSVPQPSYLSIFNHIISVLNDVIHEDSCELTQRSKLKELEAQAHELKELDLSRGFSALGSIACARRDIESMHKFHNLSIQYCKDSIMLHNYAASLLVCGEIQDAYAYAKVAYDIDKGDKEVLALLLDITLAMKDETLFLRYAASWEKLEGEPHPWYLEYLESMDKSHELTELCMRGSQQALAEIWDTPEEDAAWAHLQ